MLCMVTFMLRWQPTKIGLTSFNVIERRFLISQDNVDNVNKIHEVVSADRAVIEKVYFNGETNNFGLTIRQIKNIHLI